MHERQVHPNGEGRPVWEDTIPAADAASLDPGVPDDFPDTPDVLVIGVIFAASTTDSDVGYALTSQEVRKRVDAATTSDGASTGPCTA